MRRRLVLAFLAALAAAPVAVAAADAPPGTAQFAAPNRGDAVVVAGPSGGIARYEPTALGRRTFTVMARVPRGTPRRPMRVLVKHSRPGRRCAASFAADGGTVMAFPVAIPDAGGYLTSSIERPWGDRGVIRFCVWLNGQPRRRGPVAASRIEFFRHAAGAVIAPDYDDGASLPGTITRIVSTEPYRYHASIVTCPESPGLEREAPSRGEGLLIEFTSFSPHTDRCDRVVSVVLTAPTLGTQTLTLSQSEAAAGVVRHTGFCVFQQGSDRPDVARALVTAQGCRVGRTISARTEQAARVPGWVWGYTVNGSPASLVPTGTTVDLVVNE